MPVLARVEPLSDAPEDRRRTPRMQLTLGAVVGDHGSDARIHDISTRGLLFETSAKLPDDLVQVKLPHADLTHARIAWRHGRFFGCEFVEPLAAASVSAALLQSDHPPSTHATVEAGLGSAGRRSTGWLKATLVAALAIAGAAYLVETGHVVLLMVIAVVIAAIAALMLWAANWALDNTPSF